MSMHFNVISFWLQKLFCEWLGTLKITGTLFGCGPVFPHLDKSSHGCSHGHPKRKVFEGIKCWLNFIETGTYRKSTLSKLFAVQVFPNHGVKNIKSHNLVPNYLSIQLGLNKFGICFIPNFLFVLFFVHLRKRFSNT